MPYLQGVIIPYSKQAISTAYEVMMELMAVLDPMRRGRRLWDTDLFRMVLLSK